MAPFFLLFVICACTSKYFPVFKCFLCWILTKKCILTLLLSIRSKLSTQLLSCIFVIIHNHWHFSLGIGGLSTCTVQLTRVHQGFFQGFDSKFWMFEEYFVQKSSINIFSRESDCTFTNVCTFVRSSVINLNTTESIFQHHLQPSFCDFEAFQLVCLGKTSKKTSAWSLEVAKSYT